jgi:two-component system phosphate regulon sensor histidine kinase PhoR
LIHRAQAIAAGDFSQPASGDGPDELGALGGAFNRIQHELARRVGELEENGQRLETVLGSMVEGVIAVDGRQRVLFANRAGRRLLELSDDELAGRPLLEITRSRVIRAAVAEALRGPRPTQTEFEVPGNTRRVLALRATRLPGEPTPGAVLVLHDVTELRRLENMRREFVANVSHELKTPLASIKAYAETLQLGAVNDPRHNLEFVGRIEEQADRLHQLIVDLIHLARVESGEEAFDITDVPVAGAVEGCLARHAVAAEAKRIELRAEPSAEALKVRADEEGLRTILDNLVGNAVKYTPDGGHVIVRWRRDNERVLLEVEDNGIGIAEKFQSRVFERFYRVDKARSRELGGTGLGLSIVKHLAQAFGGGVGLASELGRGSTFRVWLPRA